MITIRKRTIAVLGATGALLVGAGTAAAAIQAGPPSSAPQLGLHAPGTGYGTGYGAGYGTGYGTGYGLRLGGVVMDAAANYLGLDETALATARHDGSSLAQIAADQGKSVAGLEQALVTAFKANLDTAVADGKLTAAQAAQVLAQFKTNVQTAIDRTATGPQSGRGGWDGRRYGPRHGLRPRGPALRRRGA